jgi:hypothetical protein
MDNVAAEAIKPGDEVSSLDLLAAAQHASACRLQLAWRVHLVRATLWRRMKVRIAQFHNTHASMLR